jgi:hypothetical protein
MTFKGLHINLAEVAMVLTALGALITAWRGGKAAKKAGKGKDDAENSSRD